MAAGGTEKRERSLFMETIDIGSINHSNCDRY